MAQLHVAVTDMDGFPADTYYGVAPEDDNLVRLDGYAFTPGGGAWPIRAELPIGDDDAVDAALEALRVALYDEYDVTLITFPGRPHLTIK